MLKYVNTAITFSEVPDEVSLCINISNCPYKCKGCHSNLLKEDIGKLLTAIELDTLIKNNEGITCVCFMGGDSDPSYIDFLAECVKNNYPNLKVAWYSGNTVIYDKLDLYDFDYIKIGPYIKDKGPLNKDTTNQIFYKIVHMSTGAIKMFDITYKFWKYND